MKKPLLLMATVIASYSFGQITIGQYDVVGSGDMVTQNNDTMPTMAIPADGAGMTWDFSSLQNHSQNTLSFGAASWFSNASYFPDATLGANDGNGFEIFLIKDAASLRMIGFAGDLFGTGDRHMYLNPGDDIIQFPANYNDSYTTNSVQTFSFPGSDVGAPVDSIVNKRYTTKNVSIDGWGSVTTPYGTFEALKINTVSDYYDSTWVYMFGVAQLFDNSMGTDYSAAFWSDDPSTGFPLVELSHNNADTIYSASWLNSAPTAGGSELSGVVVELYPNPASDVVNIHMGLGAEGELTVVDMNGKLIYTGIVNDGTKVDVAEWNEGSYLYQIKDASGSVSSGSLVVKR